MLPTQGKLIPIKCDLINGRGIRCFMDAAGLIYFEERAMTTTKQQTSRSAGTLQLYPIQATPQRAGMTESHA